MSRNDPATQGASERPRLTYAEAAARYPFAPADPSVHAALFFEIARLHDLIRAALDEIMDSPDKAYRILKHSGVSDA